MTGVTNKSMMSENKMYFVFSPGLWRRAMRESSTALPRLERDNCHVMSRLSMVPVIVTVLLFIHVLVRRLCVAYRRGVELWLMLSITSLVTDCVNLVIGWPTTAKMINRETYM